MEVKPPVDAAIRALLLLGWPRAHLSQGPPLELVLILGGQRRSSCIIRWLADHVVGRLDFRAEGVRKALLNKADGKVCNVDANPATIKVLSYLDSCAAAAERIKNQVSFVGAGVEDAF